MIPRSQYNIFIAGYVLLSVFLITLFNGYHEAIATATMKEVDPMWITPFILLLLSIAVMPFINKHWWEHNYPAVSLVLGIIVVLYYILAVDNVPRLLKGAEEYVSFIILIGSLFIISGGLHIKVKGRSAPIENVIILLVGAIISNFLGTTGASMLLIRPFMRINKGRIKPYHIVFFIFIVSNIGGALTPIGDPPLFLGYLKGIPFFWVIGKVWYVWAFTITILLLIFFLIDTANYRKAIKANASLTDTADTWAISGTINFVFLLIVLIAVFITKPVMVREAIMLGAALASLLLTPPKVHRDNDFNFEPIREVAILFAGIFATMLPALDWLGRNSAQLGIQTPSEFFWATGILSSFLDNAPTYLNFLTAEFGLHGANVDNINHMKMLLGEMQAPGGKLPGAIMQINSETWRYIQTISISAVFFGACTYIGNGPNFMVKSIAEQNKISMPSFFGYIFRYSLPILIPIFTIVWYLFIREKITL